MQNADGSGKIVTAMNYLCIAMPRKDGAKIAKSARQRENPECTSNGNPDDCQGQGRQRRGIWQCRVSGGNADGYLMD